MQTNTGRLTRLFEIIGRAHSQVKADVARFAEDNEGMSEYEQKAVVAVYEGHRAALDAILAAIDDLENATHEART